MKTGSYNGASNVVLDSKLEGFERGFVTSLAGKNSNFFFVKNGQKTNLFKNNLKSLIRANLILETLPSILAKAI